MHIGRVPWGQYFMLQAHLVATRSTCDRGPELLFDKGRHGVGCVIVKNNRVIASGFNGSPPGMPHCDTVGHLMVEGHCHRTIHSEMNALLQCALDESNPEGATLYTTASPCYDCAKLIVRAGVKEVVFGEYYDSRYGISIASRALLEDSHITVSCLKLVETDFRATRRQKS